VALAVAAPGSISTAHAAPKAKAAAAKKPKKGKADKEKAEAAETEEKAETESEKSEAEAPTDRKPDAAQEDKVKAAGSAATKEAKADVKEVKEGQEGVKSYKFGTIEIEGRLKSPQIIYFLRRVRAEFEAGALGHRSFMRELSDTRRSPSFR